ncbi:MAG: hypothetical protein ACOYL6_03940 [Bacteriovoracaceae bacterium]
MKLFMSVGFSRFGLNNVATLFLLITLALGCQKRAEVIDSAAAEAALAKYLDLRLSGKSLNRAQVLAHTTGTYKMAVESLSDEEFARFENLKEVEKNSFHLLNSNCKFTTCLLTYSLTYTTTKESEKMFLSEVEKVAHLELDQGQWKISEIVDLKTKHESLIPLQSLKNQIK